jgi:Tfp pilus assembly protein PilN
MIQFNLLPDVKLQYVKTQRTKQLMISISVLASVAALTVLLLSMLTVYGVQKKTLHDLNGDVKKYSTELKNTKDLDKILTVQNQLGTLTSLHDQKPVTSRLFGYLTQVTPANATLKKLTLDLTASTVSLGGSTDSFDTVRKYTDTLKSTTYSLEGTSDSKHAFKDVVLSSFSKDETGATFTITATFDPAIFNSANAVTLHVPQTADSAQSFVFGGNK